MVKRHLADLRSKPVWLFSSGPLDDSATEKDIPPIKSVAKLLDRVGARGHVTFGGRLEEESGDLPVGDWRDRRSRATLGRADTWELGQRTQVTMSWHTSATVL